MLINESLKQKVVTEVQENIATILKAGDKLEDIAVILQVEPISLSRWVKGQVSPNAVVFLQLREYAMSKKQVG